MIVNEVLQNSHIQEILIRPSIIFETYGIEVGMLNHHQILIIPTDHDKHVSLVLYKIYGLGFSIAICLHLMANGCTIWMYCPTMTSQGCFLQIQLSIFPVVSEEFHG
jgi:hypothetical protein